ncbi:MAG: tetratricopeptide repeat protein [Pseudomonadota bacterium]
MTEASAVFDVSPDAFQTDVIERSKNTPVVLLFWADLLAPSVETRNILAQLTSQYQGKVALGLVDVAQDPTLAQHLRVQGLPSLRVVRDGQLVEQLDGPQPEDVLRTMLDNLTLSPSDMLKDQLALLLERGDFDTALSLLQQAINEEPNNQAFRVELADVLVIKGEAEDARTVLAGIPEDTEERDRPANRLAFSEEAAGMAGRVELEETLAGDPDNLDVRYDLAVMLVSERQYEAALEQAMAILQQDRSYRDDLGRTTMIRIFTLLGKGSELATSYRRRMFNFMH